MTIKPKKIKASLKDIRVNLYEYLLGRIKYEDFEEWYLPATAHESEKSLSPLMLEYLGGVDILMSDFTLEYIDEHELKEGLTNLDLGMIFRQFNDFYRPQTISGEGEDL